MARIRKCNTPVNVLNIAWRIGLYIRLSREDGNNESYSVTNQRTRLAEYVSKSLCDETADIVDYYIDDGYTGTDSEREDFQRLLEDVVSKKINCVIVKDLSRLSRNDWECGRYLQQFFVAHDVRFISLELPALDSYLRPDEIDSLATSFQSLMNDNHCRETSIKVRGTLNMKREQGLFIGAFAPYGYLKDPNNKHRFIVNPDTGSVVTDIFRWFVYDGMSKQSITKKLISLGIPSPSAYKQQNGMNYHSPHAKDGKGLWSHRTVDVILRNHSYLGHMVQGRHKVKSYKVHTIVAIDKKDWYVTENTHEALVDQATFDLAQSLMQRDMRTAPTQKKVYPFSGFLKCADCGKGMTRTAGRGYVYYACKTYVHKSHDLCTRHSLNHKELESAVLETIKTQIDLIDELSKAIDEINNAPVVHNGSARLETALKQNTKELDKIIRLKDGLYPDWKNGDLTRDEYHRMKQSYEQTEQELREIIENLQAEREDMATGIKSNNPYFETFLKYKNVTEITRSLIVDLVKMVYVHEGRTLTIDLNFADEHRRVIEFIENNKHVLTVLHGKAV